MRNKAALPGSETEDDLYKLLTGWPYAVSSHHRVLEKAAQFLEPRDSRWRVSVSLALQRTTIEACQSHARLM